MSNTLLRKYGCAWPISVSNWLPKSAISPPNRLCHVHPRRPRPGSWDRIFDGFYFFAFVDLQHFVLCDAGVLDPRRYPDLPDAALGHSQYRQVLGAQQYLADARDL